MNNPVNWRLKYTYKCLPNIFYSLRKPSPVRSPEFVLLNEALCEELGLKSLYLSPDMLSGNSLIGDEVYSQAYAGHQFGNFTILGDGRTHILGEHLGQDEILYDIQLKGSGATRYSRRGDGKATLSAMLREYIISEAMNALMIPTTRSLAVVKTGEIVQREIPYQGGILTRVSKAHIRVGTFQFAAIDGISQVKALADYTIERLYPECKQEANPYIALLKSVSDKQADLIAKWQSVGFIHGVMNTDNMSIAGETIDYGPCAFMDTYNEKTVFSSIDTGGRYAYLNQPIIGQWNLARFAETLLPLFHEDQDEAIKIAEAVLKDYWELYQDKWLEVFLRKIGIDKTHEGDKKLIEDLLRLMKDHQLDFTNTFVNLMKKDFRSDALDPWLIKWRNRIVFDRAYPVMKSVNPQVIPRNHQVDKALKAAEKADYKPLKDLVKILSSPYELIDETYQAPPKAEERILRTYCGT